MRNLDYEIIRKTNRGEGSDLDLAQLTNLFTTKVFDDKEYYYPVTYVKNEPGAFQPKMIFVGGSFMRTILWYLDKHNFYKERDEYYYYSQIYKYPANTSCEINKNQKDYLQQLRKELLKKDIIILEANEQVLGHVGFGFVEDALKSLLCL